MVFRQILVELLFTKKRDLMTDPTSRVKNDNDKQILDKIILKRAVQHVGNHLELLG